MTVVVVVVCVKGDIAADCALLLLRCWLQFCLLLYDDGVGCNAICSERCCWLQSCFFLYDVVDYHVVFAMDAFFDLSVACDMSICCNVVERVRYARVSATKSLCEILR